MNRRNFLKALGLGTSASALSACGLDNNIYYTPIEQILPYVIKPESVTPGVPTFFATSLTSGPDAHPVLARHRDGRVIHVGVNKRAPFAPAVPKAALMELQKHYSPDRYREPMKGDTVTTWDEAVPEVAEAVKRAKAAGKKVAWLGGYRSGAMLDAIRAVADDAVFWEPLGYAAEAKAAKIVFGTDILPRYDLREAHYVLSFGADVLGAWGGVRVTSDFAHARNPNHGHFIARYAHVSAYRDQSGANADDWFQAKPGSEALVARAIAKLVATRNNVNNNAVRALGNVDVAAAAAASGLTDVQLKSIADQFASGNAVALPGSVLGASKAATELAAATYLLNIIAGASPKFMSAGGYGGPVHSAADVKRLADDLNAGKIGVLFIDDANPVHTLPAVKFGEAIAKAGLSVAFTSHPDETTAACSMVLPSADGFEDWGTERPMAGLELLRQPSMSPIQIRYRPPGMVDGHRKERVEEGWNVRSAGDVLVQVGRALNSITTKTWKEFVQTSIADNWYLPLVLVPARERERLAAEEAGTPLPEDIVYPAAVKTKSFPRWFNKQLANGYVKTNAFETLRPLAVTGQVNWTAPVAATQMPLILVRHANLFDGRYANTPWAQELPDPMTGQVWDSWAEMHPETAKEKGVADNGQITVTTSAGTVTVGVEVTESVMKGAVALQFGQGHTANGRYANEVGQNAAGLIGAEMDAYGVMAWQGGGADVQATGSSAELVSTFGGDSDEDRNFAVLVSAEQLATKGDQAKGAPGDITGIHHLTIDKRLIENNATDFYGITQHPTYRFGMTVDTDACNGCGACSVACYAENNLPVVGKQKVREGREMGWIRINRYFKGDDTFFVPMMCQHCNHAPCESVCPVLATYHNLDGLNAMIYNRCVGTRYCSNACPFSARKFNYHTYAWPEPFNMQLNPDVVTRTMGVMEKCTFCIQRIRGIKTAYKDASVLTTDYNAVVPEEALVQLPACAEVCPTQALTFGNMNDENSSVVQARKSGRAYQPLADLNVFSAVNYLAKSSFHKGPVEAHHGGHGDASHGDAGHGDAKHGDAGHGDAKHDDHGKADHGKANDHGAAGGH